MWKDALSSVCALFQKFQDLVTVSPVHDFLCIVHRVPVCPPSPQLDVCSMFQKDSDMSKISVQTGNTDNGFVDGGTMFIM